MSKIKIKPDPFIIARSLANGAPSSLGMEAVAETESIASRNFVRPAATVPDRTSSCPNIGTAKGVHKILRDVVQDTRRGGVANAGDKMAYKLPNVREVRVGTSLKPVTVVDLSGDSSQRTEE